MKNKKAPLLRPLLLLFIVINLLSVINRQWFLKKGVDPDVILVGNLILFIVSLTAFLLTENALRSSNPQAFVRAMYGSFMIKFFVIAIIAFVYIMIVKKNVNKPALLVCGALYILYTTIETIGLMKLLKQNKHA